MEKIIRQYGNVLMGFFFFSLKKVIMSSLATEHAASSDVLTSTLHNWLDLHSQGQYVNMCWNKIKLSELKVTCAHYDPEKHVHVVVRKNCLWACYKLLRESWKLHQRRCVQAWHRSIQSVQLMKRTSRQCLGVQACHMTIQFALNPIYQRSVHCANCMLNWRACTLVIHIPMHLSPAHHAMGPAKDRSTFHVEFDWRSSPSSQPVKYPNRVKFYI